MTVVAWRRRREWIATRLADGRFDLLVVGGGIIGAGVAAEAARAGLSVALVDRNDFGGATSSASSKLIHGGLRYLTLGDVGLVREAHRERRLLMNRLAPHVVRRLPFLLPIYRNGPYPPFLVHAGVTAYGARACRAEDVLRRRTTTALRGGDTPSVRERVDSILGWPSARDAAVMA